MDHASEPTGLVEGVPRVTVMTMASNEADMLPRWIEHYGRELGVDNLLVLDDHSVDGSTENLPCPVLKLPPGPWKQPWARTRQRMANDLARGLLASYDVVVFTDTDEFLVPDPARYDGLLHYLAVRSDRAVVAAIGLNVLHNPAVEGPIDPATPVLAQRRFVKFAPGMSKPLVKRIPADWTPGFHGIRAPFAIDPDLWLFHLKYYDVEAMVKAAEHRHSAFEFDNRGSPESAWALQPEELRSRLSSWVEMPQPDDVADFSARECDLSDVVYHKGNGWYRSFGQQLLSMDESPLRRIPQRFRSGSAPRHNARVA